MTDSLDPRQSLHPPCEACVGSGMPDAEKRFDYCACDNGKRLRRNDVVFLAMFWVAAVGLCMAIAIIVVCYRLT